MYVIEHKGFKAFAQNMLLDGLVLSAMPKNMKSCLLGQEQMKPDGELQQNEVRRFY